MLRLAWLCAAILLIPGCVFEPKIVGKPRLWLQKTGLSKNAPVEPSAPPPVPAEACPLGEARRALNEARIARLFHSPSAAGLYRDSLIQTLYAINNYSACSGCLDHPGSVMKLHNAALAGLMRSCGFGQVGNAQKASENLASLGFGIAATEGFMNEFEPDEIWFAKDYQTINVRGPEREKGLGLPLIVYRGPRPRLNIEPERFYPPHWKFAATAVARLAPADDGTVQPVIELVDPLENDEVAAGQANWPLARDLTTPVIHLLSHSGYRDKSRQGLFRPQTLTDEEGVTLVHPYRPGRIPLVLIHGMGCSPRIMADIANTVHADPVLRKRYQVMIVYYTTGDTILQDANVIRTAFQAMRAHYDPGQADDAWNHSVVLGHSLGGPIARILTSHSDNHFEQALFTRPWNQLAMSDEIRQIAEKPIFFEPVPEIKRVIYLAATMHGSRLADQVEARMLSTVLPRRRLLQLFYDEIINKNGVDAFQPEYRKRPPSSIDNQSPESPILAATNRLRQDDQVQSHSIQANITPILPQGASTDGLVPYKSSFIDEAESQRLLHLQDHFCTHDPRTLGEIRRILMENLAE